MDLYSCTLPLHHGDFWFSPLTIWGILLRGRGIGGGIVLIGCVRYFLFPIVSFEMGDHWISCLALYHCTMVTSGFHLWQFQVFNSGAEGSLVVFFWLVLMRDFLYIQMWVKNGDLWICSSALYHYIMVTSGFHLWQFEEYYSGAEGLVVVLFSYDLWEIFFLHSLGFELGTSAL